MTKLLSNKKGDKKMRRKWVLAIILALVVIAVVLAVVFIFVLKDKDTKKLAVQLNKSTTTGYLAATSEEYKEITKYLDEISTTGNTGNLTASQIALIKNYSVVYKTSLDVSDFVNRQMAFTKWTNVYSENGEKVVNNLNNAQKTAEKLKKDIISDRNIAKGNAVTLANLWNDRANDFEVLIDYTTDAVSKLADIYTSCVTSKSYNNDLTEVLFNFYKEQLNKTKEEMKANRESKGDSVAESQKLEKYVENYLKYSKVKTIITSYNNQYGIFKSGELKIIIENLKEQGNKSYYYNKVLDGSLFTAPNESFTASFDLGYEGAGSISNVSFKNYEKVTLNNPVREGFKFTGWKVTSQSVGTWVKDTVYNAIDGESSMVLNAGNVGNVTLTALWQVAV